LTELLIDFPFWCIIISKALWFCKFNFLHIVQAYLPVAPSALLPDKARRHSSAGAYTAEKFDNSTGRDMI
jgi:hypothetical protein